jgi:X-Pro dipeptidyl-peptidase
MLLPPAPVMGQTTSEITIKAREPEDRQVTALQRRLDRIDPPRHRYSDAIVERQLITARDGITTLALDIIRPDTKKKVPTIFFQSPYYNTVGRGMNSERKRPWSERLTRTPQPWTLFPEWYDEYFVPRGYAVVMMDQRGTRNSSGCQVYGGREEATDAVDGIEWIEDQPWSNGSVGMTGGSYDGTVAIAAAAEHPKALKAIIPIRAIGRWYDYHFFNGMQSAQHLLTPWSFTTLTPLTDNQNSEEEDVLFPLHLIERKACAASLGAAVGAQYSSPYQDATSTFWTERDWLSGSESSRAATFIIHGLHDWNVKTNNALHLWDALPRRAPKKLWLAQMEHDDPLKHFPERFVAYTHAWFAEFLKGLDTGVLSEPQVTVQRGGSWRSEASWPPPSDRVTFHIEEAGLTKSAREGEVTYQDGSSGAPIRLESAAFPRSTRIAGQAHLQLRYSLARGGDTGFAYLLEALDGRGRTLGTSSAYARGAYRDDIERKGASYPSQPQPHLPGEKYDISVPFMPHELVVPAGGRLRLTLQAADGRVVPISSGGEVTLYRGKLVVPVRAP